MKNIKVKIKGKVYWLMADSLEESGPLTLEENCCENGDPLNLFGISDGHYYPGVGMMYYGKNVAKPKDVKLI